MNETTQTATTQPALIDRLGVVILIGLALLIVVLMARPTETGPGCDYEVTPVMNEIGQ